MMPSTDSKFHKFVGSPYHKRPTCTFRAYTFFISCIAVPIVLIFSVNPNDAGVTQKQPRNLMCLNTKKS